jgi:hypothetical protein
LRQKAASAALQSLPRCPTWAALCALHPSAFWQQRSRRIKPDRLLNEIDVPVSFAGIEFRPGEWLYADADGLIVAHRSLH